MAIDKTIKSNRLLQSRRYTVASLTDAQEAFTSVLDINSREIYAQASLLPTSSLPFSGSSQNGSTYAVGGQNLLRYWYQHTLTPSNVVSASLVDAWFFINPSGSSVTPQIIQSGQQTNFISNKYADPSLTNADAQDNPAGYNVVVLVDGVKQNSANYQFDYKDGVLQFNASAPSSSQVVKVTAYQYVGQTVDTVLTSLSSSISNLTSSIANLSQNKIVEGTVTASVSSGSNSFVLTSGSTTLFSVSNTGFITGSSISVSTITASNALVTNTINTQNITAVSASFGYVQTTTGSAVIIGQEYIILNTQTPAARYAGLQIYDSGSAATASIVWDSETNHFIYQNASGSSYSGGGFIAGPRNTGSLADVTYPSLNRVLRGQGGDHLYDSNITDDNTTVSIGINTEVTGTLNITNGITGSLLGTASYASNALSASYAINSTTASYAANSTTASYTLTASLALNSNLLSGLSSSQFVQTIGNQRIDGTKTFVDTTRFGLNGTNSGKISFVENTTGLISSIDIESSTGDLRFLDNADSLLAKLYQNGTGLELNVGNFIGNLTGNADTATTATTASYITGSNVFGPYGANSVLSASYAVNATTAATASYVPASAVVGLNLSQIATGSITASVVDNSTTAFSITSASVSLLTISTGSLVTVSNLTVSDNLIVNGTASFINSENLLVKDPFILINSGSSALTDSGIVSQYNSSGQGSALYLEASDTNTYGRWAVAYDVQQGFVSVTADEYVVTAKKASGAPPATPTWGGTTNGFGNIYVNSDNGEVYIYA